MHGLRDNVEKAVKLLELNLLHIKCKKVNLTDLYYLTKTNLLNITEFKQCFDEILNDLLIIHQYIYKLEIKLNIFENENKEAYAELYLTFFSNFPEINSVDDNVYEELSRLLIENISICVLDVTKYSNFILTKKWTDFEKDNLNTKTIGKHVYYAFSNVNGQMNILFAGLKKYLGPLKDKVGEFLSDNEIKNAKVGLRQEDVSGLLKDIYLFSNFVRILFYFKDALFETRCI